MIEDIIKYLVHFIWREDYSLLNKMCRDHYFRTYGVTLQETYPIKNMEKYPNIFEKYPIRLILSTFGFSYLTTLSKLEYADRITKIKISSYDSRIINNLGQLKNLKKVRITHCPEKYSSLIKDLPYVVTLGIYTENIVLELKNKTTTYEEYEKLIGNYTKIRFTFTEKISTIDEMQYLIMLEKKYRFSHDGYLSKKMLRIDWIDQSNAYLLQLVLYFNIEIFIHDTIFIEILGHLLNFNRLGSINHIEMLPDISSCVLVNIQTIELALKIFEEKNILICFNYGLWGTCAKTKYLKKLYRMHIPDYFG